MNTKLTIELEPEVLDKLERYAKEAGKTLKEFVKSILQRNINEGVLESELSKLEKKNQEDVNSDIKDLIGIAKIPDGKSFDDLKYEYLMGKYVR